MNENLSRSTVINVLLAACALWVHFTLSAQLPGFHYGNPPPYSQVRLLIFSLFIPSKLMENDMALWGRIPID